MAKDTERRYPIKSHEGYGFCAGITSDNKQVLMGLLCPSIAAIFFDSEGTLLHVEQHPVNFFQGVNPPYNIYDKRIPTLILAWLMEIGFQPATIKVKKFFSQVRYVGIEDYPSHFEEILNDPKESVEEKNDIRESMRLWDKDGQFVLHWGNDYWLNVSGEVVSS